MKISETSQVLSTISISSRTGTHIEAPSTYCEGKKLHEIPLKAFTGPCKVIDMSTCEKVITRNDLEVYDEVIREKDIILLKTKNSQLGDEEAFTKEYVFLDQDAAEYLVRKKVKCVGFDYLDIASSDPKANLETKITLLDNKVALVEGLRLKNIECVDVPKKQDKKNAIKEVQTPSGDVLLNSLAKMQKFAKGCYFFTCLPLAIVGSGGAPARAVLMN